ncbi:MAG TPA: methyltransferase domain-containing protein [Jatrophihabitans sp.]
MSDLMAELDRLGAAALGMDPHAGPLASSGDDRSVSGHIDAAKVVARVDEMAAADTRMRFLKRVVYRFARLFLHRQRDYNLAMIAAVTDLNQQLAVLRSRALSDANRMNATMTHLSLSVEELGDQMDRLAATLRVEPQLAQLRADLEAVVSREVGAVNTRQDELVRRFATLDKEATRLHRNQQGIRAGMTAVRADLETLHGESASRSETAVSAAAAAPKRRTATKASTASMTESDAFYERFEDEHRGSLTEIRDRLEPYLTDLDAIRSLGGAVIDVGSGRGEWLDLLVESGFDAVGVDTNSDAVAQTAARGLHVEHGDAISYLHALPAASVLAVTCFHVVEHLPVKMQFELASAALRCLKPGGMLIVETPNPTNVNVGAAAFYLDPTHLRPVVPDYLTFLLSDLGYVGVETRFLHPREGYLGMTGPGRPGLDDELMWALRGPQDFAVLATAAGDHGQGGR